MPAFSHQLQFSIKPDILLCLMHLKVTQLNKYLQNKYKIIVLQLNNFETTNSTNATAFFPDTLPSPSCCKPNSNCF